MEAVRRCGAHGYFAGASCPVCDRSGEQILDSDRREQLSTFLSGALRHFPSDVGLDLDGAGWTGFDDLVAAAEGQYGWADREAVEGVVATDPKGRFERDGRGIRATYGHSVAVSVEGDTGAIPETLYHGTAPRSLDAIRREGLRPMDRQQVHLSATPEEAQRVGRRHASDPVVLAVAADAMMDDGHRIAKRGEATYTTDGVPPEYLSVIEK